MPAKKGQRIKLVYIIDILKKHSDEEHPLTATEICEHLEKLGLPTERKAIYGDLDLLTDYGLDINKTRTPKPGYYLGYRDFQYPEIRLLIDAVQAATFISVKKTRELVEKLLNILSDNSKRKFQKSTFIDNPLKSENEAIYYNIDTLLSAIDNRKKVTLQYCKRYIDDTRKIKVTEKQHKISPYALIWQDDYYYLVGNNEKYDDLIHLRIDRMKKVEETDENIRNFSEVCEYRDRFDVADYTKKAFNMFGGEVQDIELSCDNGILEQVIDRFSDKIFIRSCENGRFTFGVKALVSEGLIGFLMQFGDKITVVSPETLKKRVYERAVDISEIYK